jgi:CheY-like chemotaxis protein
MVAKKLLLAEDDGDDQKLFRDFLLHRRDVTLMPIAENGVELLAALELIEHAADLPGIIVLDHNMPRLNGLQTLQILKKEKRYSHIPVIVYSTYVDDDLIRESTDKGAFKVISKPYTKEGYHSMIDEFVALMED